MTKFRVLHDYGCEGWRSVGEDCNAIFDAVMLREAELRSNGGGDVIIVEVIDPLEAYRRADYERDRKDRQS